MSSNEKVWLVTGVGHGLGADIVRAALAAGHCVVATGRDPGKLDAALDLHERLLTVKLDITDADEARAATEAAVARFGRIPIGRKLPAPHARSCRPTRPNCCNAIWPVTGKWGNGEEVQPESRITKCRPPSKIAQPF